MSGGHGDRRGSARARPRVAPASADSAYSGCAGRRGRSAGPSVSQRRWFSYAAWYASARRAERAAAVLGLDQPRARADLADRAHREHDAAHWLSSARTKVAVVAAVRIPVAVEAAEARGRQRLVDRRVVAIHGIALGDGARERARALGEARIERATCTRGPLPWWTQPDDRPDAELAQPRRAAASVQRQSIASRPSRRDALPQHRDSAARGCRAPRSDRDRRGASSCPDRAADRTSDRRRG